MHVFQLLKMDHDHINQLLDQLDLSDDFDEKKALIEELKRELETHAYLEENMFYSLFRDKTEFRDIIEDSVDDHQEMRELMDDLESAESNEEIEDHFEDLLECVEDHIEQEENELFPQIEETMSEDELMQLGDQMEATKKSISPEKEAA